MITRLFNRPPYFLACLVVSLSLIATGCDKKAPEPEEQETRQESRDTALEAEKRATALPLESIPEVRELIAMRRQLNKILWGPEELAQRHEARFVQLWDALLKEEDKYAVLAGFPFTTLEFNPEGRQEELELQIRQTRFGAPNKKFTREQWHQALDRFQSAGYRIVQTEWHHRHFEPPIAPSGARSEVAMVAHLAREKPDHRMIIQGVLEVEWAPAPDLAAEPVPETIRVKELELLDRQAPPAFQEVFKVSGTPGKPLVLPLLVYDLNGDGLSEIVAGGQNMVIWNRGEGNFEVDTLLPVEHAIFDAAILADFTGNGHVDFLAVDGDGFPILYEGNAEGRFKGPARRPADIHFEQPKSFTAGDVDHDGDLDVFIASYKYAYRQGQMPSPYFDANDGYPAYLLENDGKGNFTDITEKAGLAPKRNRRTYSTSLVDLDNDDDLDLVVVSDYAGLDVYLNNGQGRFADISGQFGDDRHFFGMGHTFGDYNLDGQLDFYIIGMSSTTARRLEGLGLGRPDKPGYNEMRANMGYGNRMFLRKGNTFMRAPFNDRVARTGWSWGASSFDFDNDGDKDIFVANGHYSGKSTQDYCTNFWRHDIYDDGGESFERNAMYQIETRELRQADISWNGYEHKVLMMNQGGTGFTNVAFLMGVAFEYDGRAVVADDLDADGRVDLLVVEFKTEGLDRETYVLHVYRNVLQEAGNWIGVRLQGSVKGISPIGASITVTTKGGSQITRLVTGDSFSSQHPATAHFGIGADNTVEAVEVRWPNGMKQRLENPASGNYYAVSPPV